MTKEIPTAEFIDKFMLKTYLIRYWKPGKYHERKEYVIKHSTMEGALSSEKAKVPNADTYSWCIDSEQVPGQFDKVIPLGI